MDEEDILRVLQSIGDDIVKDMRVIIELNGSIASGRLLKQLEVEAKKIDETYTLIISYPFYGKWVDKGRLPNSQNKKSGSLTMYESIKIWCRMKGIPESAAYPITQKIKEEGYKGIHFTDPFYESINVVKDILGDSFKKTIIKQLKN